MPDLPDIKQRLRHVMKQRRSQIPEQSRRKQSREASLLAEQEVLDPLRRKLNRPLTVFIYASFRDEPDTSHLMKQCWMKGDHVIVPKVVGKGRLMLHELKEFSELLPGVWGIPEPAEHTDIWPETRWSQIDLIVVPGLAYDRTGGRIGFGGGFYDRFIRSLHLSEGRDTGTLIAALAFREQILTDCIPMEPHDFKVDLLFTASGTIYINESSERLCLQNPQTGN
ncbi:5-formyltetrahydrofolate cyclo-ligase [Paenibacillus lentus]|uniref:5-formyltetrahydrofolate cyclo-ligase n=1 Tax=Paenibacillus lentus TaxID=1338368 RepID=A0A3S8RTZ4_9BACL|nr:5-formyltetrahydrofolate cyclo-ligase [Paenibacillus lentus]AZK46402.1 5-formyltetrahydrofolate cyclo-ligase [Paenibacillus lentus]